VYTVLADAGAELEGKTTAEVDMALVSAASTGGGCCGTANVDKTDSVDDVDDGAPSAACCAS
jgi:hypothetical protein